MQYRMGSLHNTESDVMILGKFMPDDTSYHVVAARENAMYFDMGQQWNEIENMYGYGTQQMFENFNIPALDQAEAAGKQFVFTHNPKEFSGSSLANEWAYLKETYGYKQLVPKGGRWYAVK